MEKQMATGAPVVNAPAEEIWAILRETGIEESRWLTSGKQSQRFIQWQTEMRNLHKCKESNNIGEKA
jgi:hypothetical protein